MSLKIIPIGFPNCIVVFLIFIRYTKYYDIIIKKVPFHAVISMFIQKISKYCRHHVAVGAIIDVVCRKING